MNKKSEFRIETDLLGDVEIPSTAYWGIRTVRANLAISGLCAHPGLIDALVVLKRCALDLSPAGGGKSRDIKAALLSSCDEILDGKLQANFIADPYHCESGAALNTNVNEVIANRAEEILGGNIGTYSRVSPDKDVDLWCCPPDTEFRNAARVALLLGFKDLEPQILDLERWFRRKSLECEQVLHTNNDGNGTTVWRSLGPKLNACGAAIERCHRRLTESTAGLQEISLEDTVDTAESTKEEGTNRAQELVESLSKRTGISLRLGEDNIVHGQSMSEFLQFSSALKELSVELSGISGNLCSACSKSSESLPSPQIKHNGSTEQSLLKRMFDLLTLTACQVMANDYAVGQCSQIGQVSVGVPFAANSLLRSLDLLRSTLSHFNLKYIAES